MVVLLAIMLVSSVPPQPEEPQPVALEEIGAETDAEDGDWKDIDLASVADLKVDRPPVEDLGKARDSVLEAARNWQEGIRGQVCFYVIAEGSS